MARKWLRLLLVLGLVSVWFRCIDSKDDESHLTLESWVAAIHAPAPASRRHDHSSFLHRSSVSHDEPSFTVSETEGGGTSGEEPKKDTHDHETKEDNVKHTSTAKRDVSEQQQPSEDESIQERKDLKESDSESIREDESQSTSNADQEAVDNSEVETEDNIKPESIRERPEEKEPSVHSLSGDYTPDVNQEPETDESLDSKISKEESADNGKGPFDNIHEVHFDEDPLEDQVTSSSSTSVATARMLLVPEGPAAANNLSINTGDLFTWRLTDTNLLEDIANKIMVSGEGEAHPNPNPNRSGELGEDKQRPNFDEAASKVVVTRVRPPGQFRNQPGKDNCQEQNSWACLSPKERILLRQKLLKDLETSYNVPLPSRIRYRLKKKPSVYTSKKPNTRLDIGIPDIYETEVEVTPKYKNQQEARPTVGYPENDYRIAADISHHQYLPTPAEPSYLPIEALVTPKYSETGDTDVTKSYIPLNRNAGDGQSASLVYRPPRRPPGSTRRRTDGLLRRPMPGKAHFFTPTTDRVSIQAHLQYRRPVSFKFKRTSGEAGHHEGYDEPPTRTYTTESYPLVNSVSPYSVTVSMAPYQNTPASGYTKPPEKYIPPSNEYVAPKAPHHEPPQKYHPPTKAYEAPQVDHPALTYTEPPQKYIPPSNEYVPPHAEPEPASYAATPKSYSDPPQNYLPPNKEYAAPEIEHKHPVQEYAEPPPQQYSPPSEEYVPPKPPVKEYEEPPRKYLPPNNDYIPPHHETKQPGSGYPAPPSNYLPPDKEHSPHQGLPGSGRPYRRRRPGKRRRKQKKRPTPPSKTYLPPHEDNEEHYVAHSQYEEPETQYEPPSKGYEAPSEEKEYADSLPATTVASVFYTVPARTYLPPLESYQAPAQHYTTPIPGYIPPSIKATHNQPHHSALTAEYIPPILPTRPSGTYGTPKLSYEVPSQSYELPSKGYIITPPRLEPHDTEVPSWLMSLQGPSPSSHEEKPKAHTLNPTPPPGYHPKHSTREEHFPGTQSPHGYDYHPPVIPAKVSPKPGYHAPVPTYSPPKPGYHAPEPTYAPPKKSYDVSELTYIPPRIEHHSPKPGYHAPDPTYAPPKPGYHAPEPTYAPPKLDYRSPENAYVPPKAEFPPIYYTSPIPGYHAPEPTYVPPNPGYHAPEPTYSPPKAGYHTPEPTYAPPKIDYHPPQLAYIPPSRNYHAPQVHSTPNPGYHAPDPTYSPPKAGYHIPQPPYGTPKPGYHAPEPTYVTPKPGYHAPEPTYATPKPGYHAPEPTYIPPRSEYIPPSHKPHKPGYHAPVPTYKPPKHDHHAPDALYKPPDHEHEPGYHAPKPTYKPPVHPVTPTYAPPIRTYVPPSKDYLPPEKDHIKIPAYVPPKAPHIDEYIPPSYVSTPKTSYIPPPPPPLHIPIDPDYLPLPEKPSSNYLPPKQDYQPPAAYGTPKPLDLHLALGAPSLPHPTPPHAVHPEPEYIPPKKEYGPPSHPKEEYVPPQAPKQHYFPPHVGPQAHVTTYKPNLDNKVQQLQDFSYPGTGKVSHVTPLPHGHGNITGTYAPPVYTPSTYGPGYNDLSVTAKPLIHATPHSALKDYDDDDYYYYYDDDDYYYYYDDDEDYYYYYNDDYDYGPAQKKRPVPHYLVSNPEYDISDNEIYDFGYIAGIPGRAGRDYPILSYIPLTSFGCDLVADYPGYYADMEAGCQVFHICHRNGRQDSFLCPNGTIFNQKYFVCDWWYNFQCEDAPFFYPVNAAIGQPGVPLHRNSFEPDLRAVQNLSPLDPHHPHQHQLINHATPLPAHHTTPVPHHHLTPSHALTIAPHHA